MDAIMGQTMGGILFSIMAGQPLIVIMTTAPIALYIKIIVAVAEVKQHSCIIIDSQYNWWVF